MNGSIYYRPPIPYDGSLPTYKPRGGYQRNEFACHGGFTGDDTKQPAHPLDRIIVLSSSDPIMFAARAAGMVDAELVITAAVISEHKILTAYEQAIMDEMKIRFPAGAPPHHVLKDPF